MAYIYLLIFFGLGSSDDAIYIRVRGHTIQAVMRNHTFDRSTASSLRKQPCDVRKIASARFSGTNSSLARLFKYIFIDQILERAL